MKVYTADSQSKLPSKGLWTDLLSFLASSQLVLSLVLILDCITNGSGGQRGSCLSARARRAGRMKVVSE